MECNESHPFVSALYDGEHIRADAADHINDCAQCRERLVDYAAVGAELRLAASRADETVSIPVWLPKVTQRRRRFLRLQTLTARVMVPRFALGLGVAAILALSIGISLVRAQSRPLWFQFELYPVEWPQRQSDVPQVVRVGFRSQIGWAWQDVNSFLQIASIMSVTEIQHGRVRLAIRPRRYVYEFGKPHPAGQPVNPDMRTVERDLGDLTGHEYVYIPGQTLEIPIEGGGKLVMKGEVFDQQPKLAWGYPLEPGPDQMVLTHPVLMRDRDTLIHQFEMNAMILKDRAILINVPGEGYFTIALQPFKGATAGEASWGEMRFTLDGHDYLLLSGSPITGGDQPHAVWVSRDTVHFPIDEPAFLGTGDLPGVKH